MPVVLVLVLFGTICIAFMAVAFRVFFTVRPEKMKGYFLFFYFFGF
jgi:hypothetical protein